MDPKKRNLLRVVVPDVDVEARQVELWFRVGGIQLQGLFEGGAGAGCIAL